MTYPGAYQALELRSFDPHELIDTFVPMSAKSEKNPTSRAYGAPKKGQLTPIAEDIGGQGPGCGQSPRGTIYLRLFEDFPWACFAFPPAQ
jgi:hypothetical protein